jgi:hypothetical protein
VNGPAGTGLPFGAQVRAYLADCAARPGLDRQYHPTAGGAVKLIWHHGPDEADQIRNTFHAITAGPDVNVAPALQPPGPPGWAATSANHPGDDPNALTAA